MKKLLLAAAALSLSTLSLSAYCPSCHSNSRDYQRSNHQLQSIRSYNSILQNGRDDRYVTQGDLQILNDIRENYREQNLYSDQNNIQLTVEYGKVSIDGKVSSSQEESQLEQIAQSTPNVQNVFIDVQVREPRQSRAQLRNGNGNGANGMQQNGNQK